MSSFFIIGGPCGLIAIWLLATCIVGFGIQQVESVRFARVIAWLVLIVSTAVVERICSDASAVVRMTAIIAALFLGMKIVVCVENQEGVRLTAFQWAAFTLGWAGMRPAIFAALFRPALPGAVELIGMGIRRGAVGVGLVIVAAHTDSYGVDILATMTALAGLSLILHFGLLNVMVGLWRLAGVDCRALFRAPLSARTLSDFWGRRWNRAFSEMAAITVYRSFARRCGSGTAIMAVFLFSGLLHELAISVPVRAGYGLPTLYFVLHGLLVVLERSGLHVERWGWLGHAWVLGCLALPLPILFHPPFIREVVWPVARAIVCGSSWITSGSLTG